MSFACVDKWYIYLEEQRASRLTDYDFFQRLKKGMTPATTGRATC